MKKQTGSWIVIMLMIFLGITSIVEARTGSTSSSSSKSSSSSRSSSSSSSRSSTGSSSFFSTKPSKNTSSTDSAFSNAAKTRQAQTAWQERNKEKVTAPVAVPTQNTQTEKQLADIKKQLVDAKRQQQLIAIGQTAAQIALTNRSSTSAKTVTTTVAPVTATPVANTAVTNSKTADNGTSWFTILLVVGGLVWLVFWFKKRATPTTNYRL